VQILKKIGVIIVVVAIIGTAFMLFKKNSAVNMLKGERVILNTLVTQNRATPDDFVELGTINIMIDRKNFEYGIEMMKQNCEKNYTSFPGCLIKIGEMYITYNKKEKEKGFEYLKNAENILDLGNYKAKPNNYARIGELWYKLKMYNDALRVFDKAISFQKDDLLYLNENNSVNDPTFRKYLSDAKKELEDRVKKIR
jgi:tetratricopeptide (TPR) repeat protein